MVGMQLTAEKRAIFGKKLKASRASGKMPVVVYGRNEKASPFFVSSGEFKRVLKEAGESSIVTLVADGEKKSVLIHEVSFHPVDGQALHADLLVVRSDEKLKVEVPIEFEGVSPAVKELGGILVKVLHKLEVEALPKDLPHSVSVNLELLVAIDSQILVKDIKLPNGVEAVPGNEQVVAAIDVAKDEPVETEPVDLSAIEVEKRGKEEKEGEEGAESGDGGKPASAKPARPSGGATAGKKE